MALPTNLRFRYYICILLLSSLSSCHVIRYIYWNFADINDYKKFPADTLRKQSPPSPFPESLSHISLSLPQEYLSQGGSSDLDDFLYRNSTLAFLIIRNDTLIYENYRKGYSRSSIFPSFSISKSFIAALTGIAIQEGYIKSVDQPVTDFLPEIKDNGFQDVTIKDLLEMRSGIDFKEGYYNPFSGMAKFYYGLDLKQYCRKLKVISKPGQIYQYQSANTQILAMILEKATGRRISDYLEEKIWRKLGMEYDATWSKDSKKHNSNKAFCCINARPTDFAKFGQLFINSGQWGNKEIIPAGWIQQTLTITNDSRDSQGYPYTYHWRVIEDGDFFAKGILGQFIYISPGKKIIFVRFGSKAGKIRWPDLFKKLSEEL
ncbi:MAG: serine hydrolase [Bacteroidetes bacterium]|nr:serine hydrolase [Bacteroidota bacterium]